MHGLPGAHSHKWESWMQSQKRGQQRAAETAVLPIVCVCKFFTSQFPRLQKMGIMMGLSSRVSEMP